jgi:hypothetical protein
MKTTRHLATSCAAVLALVLGALLASASAHAQPIVQTASAGPYSVTLRVLPAESFSGPGAAMVRDGGAMPNHIDGPLHPNRHIVAFIKKDGHPVEHAHVVIAWRSGAGPWHPVSVVRMHVVGHSLATTHFGNNERLAPGHYTVRVTVDGSRPAIFHVVLPQ